MQKYRLWEAETERALHIPGLVARRFFIFWCGKKWGLAEINYQLNVFALLTQPPVQYIAMLFPSITTSEPNILDATKLTLALHA